MCVAHFGPSVTSSGAHLTAPGLTKGSGRHVPTTALTA
jgi:hypothetical protein